MSEPTSANPVQDRYANRVKARLQRPEITVADARDGILDCFLATYHQGVSLGLQGVLGMSGGDEEIARVTASMFRRRLRAHGSSFEDPSIDALARVKDDVDRELHVGDLPAEIRGVHDQVCSLLLAKADGAFPHRGPESVIGGAATVAAPIAHIPTIPRLGSAPRSPAAAPTPDDPRAALRRLLEAHLARLVRDVDAGAPPAQIRLGLERAETLVAAIDAFAPT